MVVKACGNLGGWVWRKQRAWFIVLIGALLMTGSVTASAAGKETYGFDAGLGVSASTNAAGAHPSQVVVRLSKRQNSCPAGSGLYDNDTSYYECSLAVLESAHGIQQDFKSFDLVLPSGLLADPSAASQCTPAQSHGSWSCPVDAQIGTVDGAVSNCSTENLPDDTESVLCGRVPGKETDPVGGEIYMGVPEAGEEAHLVTLVGIPDLLGTARLVKVDSSVNVDEHGHVTVHTDNLPDTYGVSVIQLSNFTMTLWGDKGDEDGHPLLGNPTSCSETIFGGDAEGYLHNAQNGSPGYGDGTTVPISADYPVTGCNSIPFNPQLSFNLDTTARSAVPGITATLTQGDGEQNMQSTDIKFPKGFGINIANTNTQCSEDQFDSSSCPEGSVIGSTAVTSKLLPEDSGPLTGNVILGPTDLTSGMIELFMKPTSSFLPDGIKLTGTAQLNSDGTLETKFDDLPDLPIQSFTLALDGGSDKGLIKNPKNCGTKTIQATFVSHQGAQVIQKPQVQIACDDASLSVDLSSHRPKAHPTVDLSVSAPGMQSLSFTLPTSFKVKSTLVGGKRYGTLSFTTEDGTTDTKLIQLRSIRSKGTTSFSATENGAQVTSLSFKYKKANTIEVGDLPANTISASLELDGDKDNFLSLPSSCKTRSKHTRGKSKGATKRTQRNLYFGAKVTNSDGNSFSPDYSTTMKCRTGKNKQKRVKSKRR